MSGAAVAAPRRSARLKSGPGGVQKAITKRAARAPSKKKDFNRLASTLEDLDLAFVGGVLCQQKKKKKKKMESGKISKAQEQQQQQRAQQQQEDSLEPFEFVSQAHYELVGRLVLDEIRSQMRAAPLNMQPRFLPAGTGKNAVLRSDIWVSPGFAAQEKKTLLVLSPGAGVMAGMWARSLCINDSLETGSMLPYLRQAASLGLPCLVLNPNCTSVELGDVSVDESKLRNELGLAETESLPRRRVPIPGVDNPFLHVQEAFNQYILGSPGVERIVIVAHSFGGTLTTSLISDNEEHFVLGDEDKTAGDGKRRIQLAAVAFTDSVHSKNRHWSPRVSSFLASRRVCNWAKSKHELGRSLQNKAGCRCVSAGTAEHERTSESARDEVFDFIAEFTN